MFALPVDPIVIDIQDQRARKPGTHERDLEPVAEDIARRVLGPVEVAGHRAGEVAAADVQRHAGGALAAAGEVVGDPADVAGVAGVDGAGGDEDAGVDDARLGAADAHDEAEEDDEHGGEDEGGALAEAVGEVCEGYGHGGGEAVDGDGQELGGRGFVAEGFDDGGEEEGDSCGRVLVGLDFGVQDEVDATYRIGDRQCPRTSQRHTRLASLGLPP